MLLVIIASIMILSLGLMSCSGYTVPDTYTTYTDKNGLFSISYPSDWELPLGEYLAAIENDSDALYEYWSSNDPEAQPSKDVYEVFHAYKDIYNEPVPSMRIYVLPLPEGEWTVDSYLDLESGGMYKEYLEERLNIDGREAIILRESRADYTGAETSHTTLDSLMIVNKTLWAIDCIVDNRAIDKYEEDFQTIIRSPRILK